MAASPTTPPISPALTSTGGEIIFESYLHKTPPLDKLFVKWKKRWFVLSRADTYDQSTLDLSYYSDHTKRQKRGTINLSKFIGIRPNAKIGHKEFIFAVETEERKYILRADDLNTKTIWLAKLCELCGQEPVYHVLLPNQPSISSSGDGILKFKTNGGLAVVSPSQGTTLMELSLVEVRRVGYMHTHNSNIVWFETCRSCKSSQQGVDQFLFAIVPSGSATAQALTKEVKVAIERTTGAFLILEETGQLEMTFVSRNHYGCSCFPLSSRNRILMGGLTECFEKRLIKYKRASEPILNVKALSGNGGGGIPPHIDLQQFRRPSETFSNMGVSLEEYVTQPHRRGTIASCSPTTPHPPRHMLSRGPTSLDRIRQASISSMTSQNSIDISDEGMQTPLSDAVFDLPPTTSPMGGGGGLKRNLSKKDSLSSHGSGGSSPSVSFDHEDHHDPSLTHMRRLSQSRPDINRPNIPPRSAASLRLRAKTPTAL